MLHWITKEIDIERGNQRRKWNKKHSWGWGDCSSNKVDPIVKTAVLQEECGEVARAVLDGDNDNLREELIQVASVAVAWLESIDSKTGGL